MNLNSIIFNLTIRVMDLKSNPKTNLNADQTTTNLLNQEINQKQIFIEYMVLLLSDEITNGG